ncbi:ELKS/Rab6-interacting/CAST family member 1-like isoform X17 [Eriocheir sinensis]|uniref:ELKS/Rab6-interacting/CAST family member 1-like isoform X17 n=1 Tax=Eriocheir sinensis TaxID=95602 RepID=UPI0021C67059|nr:ELKS/Rab6-interacting/CAST family member 1-like isoform X17 [Eriocheir sinensis]
MLVWQLEEELRQHKARCPSLEKQAMLVRQLEDELRHQKTRGLSVEVQSQLENLSTENDHLTREVAILRETIKQMERRCAKEAMGQQGAHDSLVTENDRLNREVCLLREASKELELRIETQKQTLAARDESIKKLLEMLQQKGIGDKNIDEEGSVELEQTRARLVETQNELDRLRETLCHREEDCEKLRQEALEVAERLRREHDHSFGGPWGLNGPAAGDAGTSATLTALLETKDARILSLEREVALLEGEVAMARESGGAGLGGVLVGGGLAGSRWGSRASLVTPPPTDDSRLLQVLQERERKAKSQLEESRLEIQKRDQEILALSAKMKTLEEQHSDYQRHITVLKESLCAKEEHYNMLQADHSSGILRQVEEMRQRLEEKNKTIEKKTQQALQTTQERNKLNSELTELRDHMDIKDRKINVLQRKLDLHEANQKLQNGTRQGNESQAIKRQLEEQMKMVEQKVHTLEQRNRQLDEKEKTLVDLDARLNKKREQLNHMEQQLAKAQTADGATPSEATQQLSEMRRALGDKEKEIEALQKAREHAESEVKNAQSETERLLQLMQMAQEEQFTKDKTIKELQEALRGGGGGGGGMKKPGMASTPSTPAKMDGIPAGLSTASAGHMAAQAAEKATAASEAAKATLEQAKNVAQPYEGHSCMDHHEIDILEMEGRQREYRLHVEQIEVDIKLKDSLINNLSDENKRQREHIEELEDEIHALEEEMKKNEKIEELEQLVVVVKQKNERIEELEEALRQSVRIATDMEMDKREDEERRKEINEKLSKLEARLASTQNAHNLRCTSCQTVRQRLTHVESRYNQVASERRHHLQELFDMKHQALTAALSEKDAHLALLEVGGVRCSRAAQEVETLKKEKTKLLESMKHLGEERVRLTQEYAVNDLKLEVALPDTPPPHQEARVARVSGITYGTQVRAGQWHQPASCTTLSIFTFPKILFIAPGCSGCCLHL